MLRIYLPIMLNFWDVMSILLHFWGLITFLGLVLAPKIDFVGLISQKLPFGWLWNFCDVFLRLSFVPFFFSKFFPHKKNSSEKSKFLLCHFLHRASMSKIDTFWWKSSQNRKNRFFRISQMKANKIWGWVKNWMGGAWYRY